MRVLLVNAHGADPAFGGAERYVADLATGLIDRGHWVKVLSAFPQRGDPGVETHVLHRADWRQSAVRRITNHLGDLISAPWPRLASLLRDLDPDLVHTSNLPGIGTGIWEAARRADIPVVHTLHDHYLLCPRTTFTRRDGSGCRPNPLLCGARTRRLARWHEAIGALVGPSEYILHAHRGLFPAALEHVVRPPLRSPAWPQEKPATPPRTFGYVGALASVKGVGFLLGAAPSLRREGVAVRIAGDGPLRDEVEAANGVHYAGRLQREELDAFLGSCDVGLVPSLCNEASGPPYVVREWHAAGRPVLATLRGGLMEVARDGGILAFDESPAELVEAVHRIRARDEWSRLLATVPAVADNADVIRWVDEHEAAYEAAMLHQVAPRAPA